MYKTKAQCRKWWYSLTPDEQEAQIEKWQEQKEARRKKNPVKVRQRYYITVKTRLKWLKKIVRKNPWLLDRSEQIASYFNN